MKYECVQEFQVDKYDEDDNNVIGTMKVEKGSRWELGNHHIIDGEIHLDNLDNAEWLEISKETLKSYFKEVAE